MFLPQNMDALAQKRLTAASRLEDWELLQEAVNREELTIVMC
jgi:hypothetical protein